MGARGAQVRALMRSQPSTNLHAIAIKLQRRSRTEDLSDRQEWLFNLLCHELELRQRIGPPEYPRCNCELCVSPFDDVGRSTYLG
jgi:hypothetical protein